MFIHTYVRMYTRSMYIQHIHKYVLHIHKYMYTHTYVCKLFVQDYIIIMCSVLHMYCTHAICQCSLYVMYTSKHAYVFMYHFR